MKKYMVVLRSKQYFIKHIEDKNIYTIYNNFFVFRIIKKILLKMKINNISFLYGKWKRKLKTNDYIILMDNGYNCKLTDYIKKINPKIKIIFYFWNKIDNSIKIILKDKNIDYFWTFDEDDSKKYKIKYFPQFYYKFKIPYYGNINQKCDVFFLGTAKNRYNEIKNAEKFLIENGLNTKIIISKKRDSLITYDKYLNYIDNSKAILEVLNNNQVGVSLRCLESQFFEKKLITNNKEVKKYSFYNPNNIFILGEKNNSNIVDFINSKFEKINEETLDEYTYGNWIKKLIEE